MWKMERAQKIKKIFQKTNGLFNHMNFTFMTGVSKNSLDLMFLANYGERNPSPVVEGVQTKRDEPLTNEDLTALATVIVEMYSNRWTKLGAIYGIQYDPIHNYLDEWEDTSTETVDGESSNTGTETHTYGKTTTETQTRTDNLQEVVEGEMDKTSTRTDDLTKTETHDLEKTNLRTDNLSESKTYGRTDTRTDNLMNTHSDSNSIADVGTGDESVYGLNSSAGAPASSSGSGNTRTETLGGTIANTGTQANIASSSDGKTNTGTQTNKLYDEGTITIADEGTSTTVDEQTDSRTTTNTGTRSTETQGSTGGSDGVSSSKSSTEDVVTDKDRSGRHFGNIGNLTSQKQILEEIELWKWNYMQEILNDVKEFCTLPVYLHSSEWSLVDQLDDD